jgi:hypothetical protein
MQAVVVDELYAAHMARLALERLEAERLVVIGGVYANSNLDGQKRTEELRRVNDAFQRSRETLVHAIEHGPDEPAEGDAVFDEWWKKPKKDSA